MTLAETLEWYHEQISALARYSSEKPANTTAMQAVVQALALDAGNRIEDLRRRMREPKNPPAVDSLWKHSNGNVYKVLFIANAVTKDPIQHPTTVIFYNVNTGTMFTRAAYDWDRSLTALPGPGESVPDEF